MNEEEKKILKRLWNEGVPVKEIAEELGFKSGSSTIRRRKKLGLEPRHKPPGYWDDFGNLERKLEPIIEELGHFPSGRELVEMGRSDLVYAIRKHGGYREVRKRMDYKSKMKPPGFWDNPENVDRAYDELKKEYGEVTSEMFKKEYGGALDAIRDGRYDPEIRTWNQYVRSREDEPVRPTYSLEAKVNTAIKYFTGDQSQNEIAREEKVSPFSVSVWSRSSTVLQRVIDRLEVPDVFGEEGLEEIGLPQDKAGLLVKRLTDSGLYEKHEDLNFYIRASRMSSFKGLEEVIRTALA